MFSQPSRSSYSVFSRILKSEFHVSATTFAKKHPKQIKKENLAKRAAKLAEFERTKPSAVISKPAPFFSTLHTPASAYAATSDYQHFLTRKDADFLFKQTPKTRVEANAMAAVDGLEEATKAEQANVETMRKLVSLQNGNAKSVQLWNVHKAIDWFKRKEGDTGSPEVQGKTETLYSEACYIDNFF
jgi:hypothetical protein